MNSTTECYLTNGKPNDGAKSNVTASEGGGIPMPCVLVESMSRGGAIGSVTSYGFSMGSRHAVRVEKDTTIGSSDPDDRVLTVPGGEYVWIDDPGTVIETWVKDYPRVGADDLKAYRKRIEKMLKNNKCADFIRQLLNEVKTQTGRSFGAILTTFDAIRFYWANMGGAHGGRAYWEEMGTVRAADIMNTINTEKMGGSRANQMDRRAFLISETTQAFLGETMHHLSEGGRMYSDAEMANAQNAVLVRQGLDTPQVFSDQTDADVENASRYWHPKVQSACPAPSR
jgi:hypothetical protein